MDSQKKSRNNTLTTGNRESAIAAARVRAAGAAMTFADGTLNTLVLHGYLAPKSDITELVRAAKLHESSIANGNLGQLENMLLQQATALQAMFIDLAMGAKFQSNLGAKATMTSLALKCAAQSSQSISRLAEMKRPKSVLFAKQANLANGPQQVNNETSRSNDSFSEKNARLQNEVLERHNERMDGRATRAASEADQVVEALGEGNRTADV